MKNIIATIALAATFVAGPYIASASAQCIPQTLETSAGVLAKNFGEVPIWRGAHTDGFPVVLFMNAETGTWTLLFSPKPGTTCDVGSGDKAQFSIEAAPSSYLPGDPA